MLHRKLLSQDQLRPLVDGDLKDLIARKLWRTAIGVCRALQHERDFDVVYWIFQLLNQGDSGAREEAAALLNRHIDTVQRERSGARALFQRLHEHIAEKGKDTRPSTGIVASSLARLVFHKSARLRRLEADGGPHIAPFFLLDKPVGDSTGLVDEIDAVLAMLLHAPSAEVAAREAGASCEAVLDIWSAVLAGGEMSTPLNDAARSKFTDRLDGALALKDARIAKGITVGLTIVEAFEQLRTIGKRFRGDVSSQGGGGIRAELMDQLHLKLEQDYDVSRIARFKEGMKVAAVAAANLLAGYREPLGGRFDIAQRLERWVGR
jgi:hypothetical protein